MFGRIKDLVDKLLVLLKYDTYILDVYIDIAPRHKAWVQDVSQLLPEFMLQSNLFTYEEI